MKKISILVCIFLSSFVPLFSQTQAEIDKMIKDAQDQIEKLKKDPATKDLLKDLPNLDSIKNANNKPAKNNSSTNELYSSDPGAYGNVDNWKFPAKNTALLASLPKKVFTKTELISFLNDTYLQLSKKLPPGISSSVQSIAAKYNNDGNKMGDAAVAGWYTNYQEESLLLILRAAANNPDNRLLLNNCAALLNMSGIEQKAIPVLKYVLQSSPGNSMLLNNLGQAYAGLGETDTAMVYLGRCMKIEPEHPEACNTAGQIEATKGNKEKAAEYFEKSIKSAYSKTAELKLRKIKKDSKIVPLVRPRVKLPEYFNLFKYELPAQCTSTDNAAVAAAEHAAFREMISKQSSMYGGKWAELVQKIGEKIQSRLIKKDEFMAHPFYEFCGIMARDVLSDYDKELSDFNSGGQVYKKYISELETLENEYQSKYKIIEDAFAERGRRCCLGAGGPNSCCVSPEERCKAFNELANQYLPKFAALTEDWQKKSMLVHQKYFDEVVYWHYLRLHPSGNDNFRLKYYEFILYYLHTMGSICQTRTIEPCEFIKATATKDSNAIGEIDCPLEIEIPFIVGKFELNCDKISFKAGEGVVFGYEKNFKTRKSTLSIGIGANIELGKVNLGPVEAKISAGVSESLFITFDGDNKVADYGLKFDAKISAGAEIKGGKEVAPGKSVEVKRELNNKEVGVGYTFGINSGWDFNEGPFKGMIGPSKPVQINKNIKVQD